VSTVGYYARGAQCPPHNIVTTRRTPPTGEFGLGGARIKALRLERFLDIGELAERAGLHRDHVGRLERGGWNGGARPSTIRKLSEALGVDPAYILED
jgi:DNA-binding Xre family transcriptional regulator